MPLRRDQAAREEDVPTSVELARTLRQLAQLTQENKHKQMLEKEEDNNIKQMVEKKEKNNLKHMLEKKEENKEGIKFKKML
nr:hypothetical protein Iba_chr14bCG10840 [Ipomoea batatas]